MLKNNKITATNVVLDIAMALMSILSIGLFCTEGGILAGSISLISLTVTIAMIYFTAVKYPKVIINLIK